MSQLICSRTLGAAAALAAALLSGVAAAATCQNQALSCRIEGTSAQLVGDAFAAGHTDLENAARSQFQIAYDFCRCNFSVYPAGSGDLWFAYDNVKAYFGALGGAPHATQPEVNRMLELRREFGQ